jgi:signal transduction histidine kinase
MKSSSLANLRWYALVGGLAAILGILAALQYRSSKRISDATTEQMKMSLNGSLADVRQGFERELTPLCRELQARSNSTHEGLSREYLARFDRWHSATAHPRLVADLYLWSNVGSTRPELLKLNANRSGFEPAEWPSDLSTLRDRLQEMTPRFDGGGFGPPPGGQPMGSRDMQGGPPPGQQPSEPPDGRRDVPPPNMGGRFEPSPQQGDSHRPPPQDMSQWPPFREGMGSAGFPSSPWMIDQNVAAVAHRIEAMGENPGRDRPRTPEQGWIVVVLNVDILRSEVFPEVIERYFGKNQQSPYQLAVKEQGSSPQVLYSSDEGFGSDQSIVPDAALNLFGRPQAMNGRNFDISKLFLPDVHPESGPGAAANATQQEGASHDRNVMIDPIHYASGDGTWEVIAKNRKGSVEAAVTSLFHRNLLINFGVLLVLAMTIGMIIAISARSRKLAQLQMDFVASVSHELRTPLTGIVAAAQNIADGVVTDKDRVSRYGAAITSQAQQLSELVEQILLFSATQKDKYRYHIQPVDVSEVLDSALKAAAGLIRSEGATVSQEIPPNLPAVSGDFKALSQCLQNLITNAVKYGGDNRWVGIHASVAPRSGERKEIQISVEDKGLGISREDLKRIFEPFYRSPAVTSAQIHGTGLGLPLAKSMVEAMRGRLTVESAPQKGSTFTLHLPVSEGVESLTPEPSKVETTSERS